MRPAAVPAPNQNNKAFQSASYVLVFMMMACGALTLSILIQNAAPGWHSGTIAVLLILVVLDRLLTHPWLRGLAFLSREWSIAHASQLIVIALALRLMLYYSEGFKTFRADVLLFAQGEPTALLNPEFIFSMLLAFLLWYVSWRFLNLIDEIQREHLITVQDAASPNRGESVPARQQLASTVIRTGTVLVILTTITRLDLRTFGSGLEGIPHIRLNQLSGGEAGTLFYFVFGLALLSLVRLLSLQARWHAENVRVMSGDLARRWSIYGVLFFIFLAVIVSLLPFNDNLGLFKLLQTLFNFLLGIIFFIGQFLLVLLALLFSIPMMLLRGEPLVIEPEAPPALPTLPPVVPEPPAAASELWILVRSILLWGGVAAVVLFSLVQFARQHGELRALLRGWPLYDWIVLIWRRLSGKMAKARTGLARTFAAGWHRRDSQLEDGRSPSYLKLIHLRLLDHRRQVHFFYLAMIRRGGEQGLRRGPSQTPYEYAVMLEKSLPSSGSEIDSITEAFMEARYSRREIDSRKARFAKTMWDRIRRALQARSRENRSTKDKPEPNPEGKVDKG